MNIVLLQTQPTLQEIELLIHEFPQYLFLSLSQAAYENLNQEQWSHVEVIFGNQLTEKELTKAHQLHWIHICSHQSSHLCIESIIKRGSILLTSCPEENTEQTGEFVLGAILSFGKRLFSWKNDGRVLNPDETAKLRSSMWTLNDKTLLQIGLGKTGTAIAKQCQQMNMRVFGAAKLPTFHPFCQKTVSFSQVHPLLKTADVVCLCLPNTSDWKEWFGKNAFNLMKEDAILVVIGGSYALNIKELLPFVKSQKFRGVIIDTAGEELPDALAPLLSFPNVLITTAASSHPKEAHTQAFRSFLLNLRHYAHGDFSEMRLIDYNL